MNLRSSLFLLKTKWLALTVSDTFPPDSKVTV
jgi:hypothetical protein